jgi:Ca-activated chloride channel homolog
MNFLAPAAFWFAAAIPVVILFYLLKRKRVVRLVSSTLLWQKFLAETQANAPFQRLRHNWLLLLQILLLLLAILALARPYFAGKTRAGALLVIVLDASASMQSTDVQPSRFEKARAEALAMIGTLKEADQMVVLQAAGHTEVRQSATGEKAALRRALEGAAVADAPTRLAEALKLAETLIQNNNNAEIHLFSDGAIPDLGELQSKHLPLVFHRVGERANNVGIVALDVRAHPEDSRQRAIFTSVANASAQPQQVELEIRFNDQVLQVKPVTLAPRETSPQVFVAGQSVPGIFTVRIVAQDDLATDNQASIVSLLPQPVKVLLVSKGNRFLEKALRSVANVELSVTQLLADSARGFDLVVLDDVVPAVWPEGNTLALHTASTNWFAGGWGRAEAPDIVDWKSTHPLLRFVSFDAVSIAESLAVKPPPWAIALAESQQTPLILAGEIGRQRIVWVAFDPLQSTWPLRVSFPIFIANAVDWLNPAAASASQLTVRAGDPFRLALTEAPLSPEILLPDGTKRPLVLETNAAEIVFGETTKQGVYRLHLGTNQTTFCVNLTDAAESDTTPKSELQFGKYEKVTATVERRANLEIWRWIAAGALAVLLFEWWFYHRRTA